MYNLKMKKDFIAYMRICTSITLCKNNIFECTIKEDGSVDVLGNVHLTYISKRMNKRLTRIPIKFGVIHGFFSIDDNELTSLENFPDKVNGSVWVGGNKKQFTDKEVRKVCKVGGGHDIHV